MPEQRCHSIRRLALGSATRPITSFVQCHKSDGHQGHHFATWGGSQAWRQTDWNDGDDDVITELPKGRKVRNP